ncbi:MAG: hypothetical protein K2N23_00270 [Clostridia bacterium]|nr:hypothetical protein [Clostridia bacterium]
MKAVLISIQPYYVFLIIARLMGWNIPQEKTVEVRKDYPKDNAWNKEVRIYCSKNSKSFKRIPKQYQPFMKKLLGKVIGEFVCDRIDEYHTEFYAEDNVYQEIRRVWLDPDYDYPYEDFEIIASNDAENLGDNQLLRDSSLSLYELKQYVGYGWGRVFGWHISDLKIYDKPKELGEFKYPCRRGYNDINNAWCYRERGLRLTMCKYNDMKNSRCSAYLTRPPQSWCYVEG